MPRLGLADLGIHAACVRMVVVVAPFAGAMTAALVGARDAREFARATDRQAATASARRSRNGGRYLGAHPDWVHQPSGHR